MKKGRKEKSSGTEKEIGRDFDFIIRESESEYREKAKAHLTSHALADFRRCPLLYWKKKQGLVADEDRPAYLIGQAAHSLILEGIEKFEAEYAVGGPINEKTGKPYGPQTKAYANWAVAIGKAVLTDDHHRLITCMAASVNTHPVAVELLADGTPEAVVRAEYCGMPCQARIDFLNPERGIIDLKTCDDLTWFEADARRFGYAHQFCFYQSVLAQATGEVFPVHVIAVEKKEPFRCGVWQMSEQTLATAQRENEAAVERLKQCKILNSWPTGYEEVRFLDYV